MARTPRKVTPQRQRRKEFVDKLEQVNAAVWARDECKCLVCGSKEIVGVPYRKGVHHIGGRNSHPSWKLLAKYMCLLCVTCHGDNANTKPFQAKLLKTLRDKYGYDYSQDSEAQWLIDTFYPVERIK